MNKEIEVRKAIVVPLGDYCKDYKRGDNIKPCEHSRMSTSDVSWSDGLGSPGTLVFYRCNAFGVGLRSECGVGLEKCKECLSS